MPRKRRNTGNPTLSDVAREAGVSAITASRALRTPAQVSPQARARISAAIRLLNYHPDPAAKTLASARSDVIGVLIPSVTNNAFADTIRGIYDIAGPSPYTVQLANTRYSPVEEERHLHQFLSQRPAGLIIAGIDQSDTVRALLADAARPLVQIFETGPDPIDMMVGFSHFDAARAGAEHLIAAGYRRIGFLGARMDPRAGRRLAGFRAGLEGAGLFDSARVVTTTEGSTVTRGCALLAQLLVQAPDTEAVLCNNDDLSLGALFECQRRGIGVPHEFGICGFNDMEMAAVAFPTLTSVRTPRREIGRRAVEMLIARIAADDAPRPCIDLGYELIARDSTNRGQA